MQNAEMLNSMSRAFYLSQQSTFNERWARIHEMWRCAREESCTSKNRSLPPSCITEIGMQNYSISTSYYVTRQQKLQVCFSKYSGVQFFIEGYKNKKLNMINSCGKFHVIFGWRLSSCQNDQVIQFLSLISIIGSFSKL